MSVEVTGASAKSVTGAIRQAAQRTGADFHYLLATARVESNLNPTARAMSSSAGGLFQFLEQTWLGTLKHAGPSFGYGRHADAISINSAGRYEVQDARLRQDILNLRNDPTANALMAGAFTQWNGEWLAAKLGRTPTEGELYLAHFLGAGGAAKLIALAASSPQANAADTFPRAAGANRAIFYDKQGQPRSVAQVYDLVVGRYGLARARSPGGSASAMIAQATPVTAAALAASRHKPSPFWMSVPVAALAPLPAGVPQNGTDGGPVLHKLFHTSDRSEALAPVVTSLWGSRELSRSPPHSQSKPAFPAEPRSLLRLFHDNGDKG